MEKMLSTNEAAERLGVTAIRVRQLISEGRIKAQKVGRDYIIAESALKDIQTYGKPGRPKKEAEAATAAAKPTKAASAKKAGAKPAGRGGVKKGKKNGGA
jgi:excisionase family DNA binding protein